MRKNPFAWVAVSRLVKCRYCGDEEVAWVKSKDGKWYLVTAYKNGDGFVANRLDPHSKRCENRRIA